jgi:hypothetical protein
MLQHLVRHCHTSYEPICYESLIVFIDLWGMISQPSGARPKNNAYSKEIIGELAIQLTLK